MGSRLKRSRNITQCSALCPTDISPSPTYKTEGIWGQCPNNQKFPDIWVSVGNHPRTEECFPKNGCPSILENTSPPLANPTQDTLPPHRAKTVPTRCASPIHTIDHPNSNPLRNHGTSAGPSSRRQRIQHLLVKFLHTDPIPLRPWKSIPMKVAASTTTLSVADPTCGDDAFFMASTPYNIDPTVDLPLNPLIYRLSCRLTQFPPHLMRRPCNFACDRRKGKRAEICILGVGHSFFAWPLWIDPLNSPGEVDKFLYLSISFDHTKCNNEMDSSVHTPLFWDFKCIEWFFSRWNAAACC